MFPIALLAILLTLLPCLLVLHAGHNYPLLYRFDRALTNDRDEVPRRYELPRYYELSDGQVDTSVRWPGWDGWYFFMLPDDRSIPTKMIRGSLMTGLYGLQGIDDYEEILHRLSTFEAAEHLCLVPTDERVGGRTERENYLSQHYLPKKTDLQMDHRELDVEVTGPGVYGDEERERWGRIRGRWPDYEMELVNPEAGIRVELEYSGDHLVWWADLPGLFTYFSAFGSFEGSITYAHGTTVDDPHEIEGESETYELSGRGCFEHGFGRRPFNFDAPSLPLRLLGQVIPTSVINYHYEVFIGDDGAEGGFMKAGGLGVDMRNHGGIYLDGRYLEVYSIRVDYLEDPPPEKVDRHCHGEPQVQFYRRWRVRAMTDEGKLEYVALRDGPPAAIAPHMMYYYYTFEGSLAGEPISGRGYGEYVDFGPV